jgi:hypothetical protein
MTAFLNIKVSRAGVEKISADTETISDLREISELVRASDVATRLLNDSVAEYFAGEPPVVEEPTVLLPAFIDGERDLPRRVKILVGDGPADPSTDAPRWFVASLKKAFPEHTCWEGAEELPGGDSEAAWMVFQSVAPHGPDHWLDHWGFCGETLISEPYGIHLEQIEILAPFFRKLGWTFNITGVSSHYPSSTIRMEIRPTKASS